MAHHPKVGISCFFASIYAVVWRASRVANGVLKCPIAGKCGTWQLPGRDADGHLLVGWKEMNQRFHHSMVDNPCSIDYSWLGMMAKT